MISAKILSATVALLTAFIAHAATTINATNSFAYGANVAWLNWRGDSASGAVIGEHVCSGYVWSAGVGWIHLGNGSPANGVRYQNNAANDYGVNHDGRGNLRGFAYNGNVGWLAFTNRDAAGEDYDGPRFDLLSGQLSGFVWGANVGWISLSNEFARVQTDRIEAAADSDGDGIADAWELTYTNTLAAFTTTSDHDGDGTSDRDEYGADTNPFATNDLLRITAASIWFGAGSETNMLTWTTQPTRLYRLQYRTNLNLDSAWIAATTPFQPDPGTNTTRVLTFSPSLAERYFRVEAVKPLSP